MDVTMYVTPESLGSVATAEDARIYADILAGELAAEFPAANITVRANRVGADSIDGSDDEVAAVKAAVAAVWARFCDGGPVAVAVGR